MTTYIQSWYEEVDFKLERKHIIFEAENDNEARKKAVFPHKDVYFAQLAEHIEIKPKPKKVKQKVSKPYYRNERW